MLLKQKELYRFGAFTLETSNRTLTASGKEVGLTPKALDLLLFLVANPGTLFNREQLLDAVWGQEHANENSLDQRLAELRKVFGQFDQDTQYIKNKHGQGWHFSVVVERVVETESPTERSETSSRVSQNRTRLLKTVAAVLMVIASAFSLVRFASARGSAPQVTGYRQLTNDGLPKNGRLLTDGRLIYFTENLSHEANPKARVAAVPVFGGDVVYPPTPMDQASLLDIASRTGDRLYFQNNPPQLFLWKSKTGLIQAEGNLGSDGALSGDGLFLAICGNDHNLHLRNLRTQQEIVQKFSPEVKLRSARWSPDGNKLRFNADNPVSGTFGLWEISRDGTKLHQLPIRAERNQKLRSEDWTPDGRFFIFSKYGISDRSASLWSVAERWPRILSEPSHLTNAPLNFNSAVAAVDGSSLFAVGVKLRSELVRFDLSKRAFVSFWDGLPAIDVSFSKDGELAAFGRFPDYTIWVSRADGSQRRQITTADIEAYQPHWSPDNSRIAFMGRKPGKPWRIYIVKTVGGTPIEAKADDPFDQGVPSWSADGESIVFGELKERKPDTEMVIRVIDLKSNTESILPGSIGKWSPRWSPDGRYILAQTADFKELHIFDCKAKEWKFLARAFSDNATWTADGKFVHFDAATEHGRALFRVRVANGKIEELAVAPENEYAWSGVAPDGSPLASRAVKVEEIYALDLKLP